MIKLEAQERRGVPVIKLDFAPQSEQFTGLGRALIAFVKHAEEHFHAFDKGEITFGWTDRSEEPPITVVVLKKPIVAYKDVSLPSIPTQEKEIIEDVVKEVETTVEVTLEQPVIKNKKKKVETKPASI